jgi:hypothetical protein
VLPTRQRVEALIEHVRRDPQESLGAIHIVVAGGRSYFAAVLPGWGGFGGFAVTREIRRNR